MVNEYKTVSALRLKRQQWLKVLDGEDQHSIYRQLAQVAWDAASFKVINEARKLTVANSHDGFRLNGLIHDLLDRGFFTTQLLAIRRLTDVNYPLEGRKSVWSLTGLLDDMAESHRLLTRAAMFEVEGLEYDVKRVRERFDKWSEQPHQGLRVVPNDMNFGNIVFRHSSINRLIGKTVTSIIPDDTVGTEVFTGLREMIVASCDAANLYVNKFLAHAASPDDRRGDNADSVDVTLGMLREAHQVICQVASFLSIYVLGAAHPNYLPVPQYNLWENIEVPLVNLKNIPDLRKVWAESNSELHDWTHWGLDGYARDCAPKKSDFTAVT